MSQMDNDVEGHVPGHFVVLAFALVLSTATLAVQLTYLASASVEAGQMIVTLRVICTVVWAWYFAAYVVHSIGRRLHVIEEQLHELESTVRTLDEGRSGQANGLDSETIESARVIAHRLMRGRQ